MILSLHDGRRLGYEEAGDPGGKPLFFFHGMPGSRFFHPHDEITQQMGVRLIAVDRPGYGESSFQPGRRILDWAADVGELADALRLEEFVVAGHSGGGPYALACAFSMPERVAVAASLCGAAPPDTPHGADGMEFQNRLGFLFGRYVPWFLWRRIVWLAYRHKLLPVPVSSAVKRSIRPPADEDLMDLLEVREHCIASEKEGFRPGLEGFAWDAHLLTRPWGFRLEDIRTRVQLWHGTADNMTPFPMARFMATKIPDCKVNFCKGEAHLLIFPHWQDILTQLFV